MLRRLSGRTHQVLTGWCVCRRAGGLLLADTVCTDVVFKELSEDEIRWYIQTGEPFDKAGAYAIQGIGTFLVRRISGSYTNVVGLPVCEVLEFLIREKVVGFDSPALPAHWRSERWTSRRDSTRYAGASARRPWPAAATPRPCGWWRSPRPSRPRTSARPRRPGRPTSGENYIQEAREKVEALRDLALRWHFIGHLQRNKARQAVRMFDLIHTVDSVHLGGRDRPRGGEDGQAPGRAGPGERGRRSHQVRGRARRRRPRWSGSSPPWRPSGCAAS